MKAAPKHSPPARYLLCYVPVPSLAVTYLILLVSAASAAAQAQTPPCCATPSVLTRAACTGNACMGISDAAWLNFSGEYRVRAEALDAVNFGIAAAPQSRSLAHRFLLGFDLRSDSGVRGFVQLSLAEQGGRKPVVRPFDESAADFAQAYVDLPFAIGTAKATLRMGRHELAFGNRLVALRDGVTLRRAFDGVRLDLEARGQRLVAFRASPVENRPDAFDDRNTAGETFSGVSWWLSTANRAFNLFAFERRRDAARYFQIAGPEQRQTFGLGFMQTTPRWELNTQIGIQTGHVKGEPIFAQGGFIDIGYRPAEFQGLRLGGQLGIASGDGNPNDRRLGTFDPLYPNLGAYNDAPLYYYANQINAQLSVRQSWATLTLGADATLLARASTNDALYVPPGRALIRPASGRRSAFEVAVSARWRLHAHAEIYIALLRANALAGIRAAGGRDTNFALIQMTTGF
jgi:hypothetical protein